MNIDTNRYSPFPMSAYRITSLKEDEITTIGGIANRMTSAEAAGTWNLFWLSVPSLDSLPEHGKTLSWFKHYVPTAGALGATTRDALHDDGDGTALLPKLAMHPAAFLRWFTCIDASVYRLWLVLGKGEWVDTVTKRAQMAADRVGPETRGWQH